jgi:hypothetical protein
MELILCAMIVVALSLFSLIGGLIVLVRMAAQQQAFMKLVVTQLLSCVLSADSSTRGYLAGQMLKTIGGAAKAEPTNRPGSEVASVERGVTITEHTV